MKQTMLRWGFALALSAGISSAGFAQASANGAKDDLFAGTEKFAKGATNVEEITMDPDSLDMVSGSSARRAHSMVLNVVRSYTYDKPGMYRIEDVDEFRHKLESGDWHCSVHIRELKSGESTDVCNRVRPDGNVESAIITVEPKELTFIHTIRKPRAKGDTGPDSSLGDMMPSGPEGAAEMAALGPVMQARMLAMQPLIDARIEALGPEMAARMAAMGARLHAIEPQLRGLERLAPVAPLAPGSLHAPSSPVAPTAPQAAPSAPKLPQP